VKIGVCSANSGPYTTREAMFELAEAAEAAGTCVTAAWPASFTTSLRHWSICNEPDLEKEESMRDYLERNAFAIM
jgi:hypothetical protein